MNLEITTPMRTLLCEDDGITVMQLRKALLLGGFDIVGEAMSGRKAIELALSLKPDLILMDINMPGSMNGISAAREIVQHLAVPIIMLTAYSDDDSVNDALEAGACAYLVKPITREQLLPAIYLAVTRFRAIQTAIEEATDLREAHDIRRIVEKAVTMLLEQQTISENEAYRVLQQQMDVTRRTLRQTAQDILDGGILSSIPPPEGPIEAVPVSSCGTSR